MLDVRAWPAPREASSMACGVCGGSKFGLTWDGVARCSKHDRSSSDVEVRGYGGAGAHSHSQCAFSQSCCPRTGRPL